MEKDFDRPLNDRGKTEAPEMGKKLRKLDLTPDIIISSSAKRTRQTAKRIADEVGYDTGNIKWEEKLYHCAPVIFEEAIFGIEDSVDTVFIVAHNPGITDFVNQLSPTFRIDNMPTCGLVGVHFEAKKWNEFSITDKKVFLFEYPGKI